MEKAAHVFSTISDQVVMSAKWKVSLRSITNDHSVFCSHSSQASLHSFDNSELYKLRIQNIMVIQINVVNEKYFIATCNTSNKGKGIIFFREHDYTEYFLETISKIE